jgi:hypothetical protein
MSSGQLCYLGIRGALYWPLNTLLETQHMYRI